MKFFRQTKETKRKLSFFLALAMVVSLLPVSPVAKAKNQDVNFYCNVTGGVQIKSIQNGGTIATGSATVVLEATGNNKKITTINTLGVSISGTSTTPTATTITVTDSSVQTKTSSLNVDDSANGLGAQDDGTYKVKVTGIVDGTTSVHITGTATVDDKSTGDTEPTPTPTGGTEPTPTPTGDTKPTPTPTGVVGGTITGSAVGEIGEASADVSSVDKNLKDNLKEENIKVVGDYTPKQIQDAVTDGKCEKSTSLEINKLEGDKANTEKAKVTKSDAKIDNLKSNVTAAEVKSMVDDGVVLDISLITTIFDTTRQVNGKPATMGSISIKDLGDDTVTVTMSIPKSLEKFASKKGFYYVIRIHDDGSIKIIKCDEKDGKITFKSDKFSTYIVTFKEGESIVNESSTSTPVPNPGNNNGYIPGPGQSPAPSSSAAPSSTPSSAPSGTPGTNPTNAPGNPSGAPTDPTNAPSDPTNAPSDPTKAPAYPTKAPGTSTSVKVGKKATISGSQYKVTSVTGTRTVQFTKGKKNAKKIVIPSTVKVSGKNYKVTAIAKNALKGNKKLTKLTIGANVKKIGANAFKGCSKLKNIVVKTKKLTKSKVGSNAFKGINAKATIKVPKAKVKAYKKIVKAKGAGKNVKVKK